MKTVKLGGLPLGLLVSGALEEAGAEVAIIEEVDAGVVVEEANSRVVDAEVVVPQVWVPSSRGIPGLLLPS